MANGKRVVAVDIELTDAQILETAAEIYLENPTAFLGNIISIATATDMHADESGMSLH